MTGGRKGTLEKMSGFHLAGMKFTIMNLIYKMFGHKIYVFSTFEGFCLNMSSIEPNVFTPSGVMPIVPILRYVPCTESLPIDTIT